MELWDTVHDGCESDIDFFSRAQCIDPRHAVECVVEAYELDPKRADAWLGLGCPGGGTAEGTPKTAVECPNEALCLKPDDADVKDARLLLRGSLGKKCLGTGSEHRTDGLIMLDGHLLAN